MKTCDEMFNSLLKRRDEYLINKKKNRKFAVSISLSALALVVCSVLAIALLNKDFFIERKIETQTSNNNSTTSKIPERDGAGVQSTNGTTVSKETATESNSGVEQSATATTSSKEASTNKTSTNNSSTKKWPEKVIEIDYNSAEIQEMTAKVTPWDERTITGQYNEIDFNGVRYSTKIQTINKELLNENLGTYKAIGLDDINDKLYEKQVTAYSVKKLSQNAVIAVNFEGTSEFYVCTNPFYSPATLGDFINDLNLRENLTFGLVGYDNSRGMGETYVNEKIEITNLKAETVWEKLLNDTTLKNVYSLEHWWHFDKMNISVNFTLLGYKNINIGITEDGYITTNILDTGKAFFIGPEKSKEFMDYVLETCDGYKIVYKDITDYKNDEQKEENNNVTENTASVTVSHSVDNSQYE